MKVNVIALAIFSMIVVAFVSFAHAQSSVFDNLQPQPKKIVVSGGFCEDVTNVRFVKKTIEGVRSDLLPEAYELLIAGDGVTVYASDEKGKRYAKSHAWTAGEDFRRQSAVRDGDRLASVPLARIDARLRTQLS